MKTLFASLMFLPLAAWAAPDDGIVIRASSHPAHSSAFQGWLAKRADLRAAVAKKGLDVAFTEWMREDHPYLYATVCVKKSAQVISRVKNTPHYGDFEGILSKRADLRALVAKKGNDAAFLEWLSRERPQVFAKHNEISVDSGITLADARMSEFMALLAKRSDLQREVSKSGLTAAFNAWLARQKKPCHPSEGPAESPSDRRFR
jgi:hypothetical protein